MLTGVLRIKQSSKFMSILAFWGALLHTLSVANHVFLALPSCPGNHFSSEKLTLSQGSTLCGRQPLILPLDRQACTGGTFFSVRQE